MCCTMRLMEDAICEMYTVNRGSRHSLQQVPVQLRQVKIFFAESPACFVYVTVWGNVR